MAKGKKKESLTPEERLQAALVPESEQPYKVPENWICFRFTSLIDIEGGTQPPKSQFIDECREGYIRLVQIRDFASDKYIVFVPDTDKLRHFNEEDILIARYGASLGRICTGMSGAYNVALAKTIFSSKVLNRKYVYWMLQSESFQAPLLGISRTAQAGFNKEDLSTCRSRLSLNNSALLTGLKACLPSWTRPSKRPRMRWTALRPAKPPSSTKPSPANSPLSGGKNMAWGWRVGKRMS